MEKYINEDFMLLNETAKELYHTSAADKPIIDYHCHLSPKEIAENHQFRNMTDIWLGGDHYKWRAMRANGVTEDYITGDKPDYQKFEKWADTLQYAMRNPLYHWTHLELSRVFGVDEVLNPSTASQIYEECNEKLKTPEFRAQAIMKNSNVEVVCTTDDPIDSLEYHKEIAKNPFGVKVLPTWRPDKLLSILNTDAYNAYVDTLSDVADVDIATYEDLLIAIKKRQDYFAENGCRLADHGITPFFAADYTDEEVASIFAKSRSGKTPTSNDALKFQSALMVELGRMNHSKDWVQQFHIGAIRNMNTRMFQTIGVDSGFDAIGDQDTALGGHKYLDRLAISNELAKTILYNLNPKDNDVFAVMANTFCEGPIPGKVQYGAAWWFLDQEQGMKNQINSLSALGLLSRFVGMLTDSRSFLSYPRHEYFRRILCNIIGEDIEQGKLPRSEMAFIHKMIADISYNNAKSYFNF